MSKKKLKKLGGKVARGLIDLLAELTGEKRKKNKEKPNERKKMSSVDRSSNFSS